MKLRFPKSCKLKDENIDQNIAKVIEKFGDVQLSESAQGPREFINAQDQAEAFYFRAAKRSILILALSSSRHFIVPNIVLLISILKKLDFSLIAIFGSALAMFIFFVVVVISSILVWYNYVVSIDDVQMHVREGVFVKKAREIPLDAISTIDESRTIFDQILGIVKIQVDTKTTISKGTFLKIRLSYAKADAFRQKLEHFGRGAVFEQNIEDSEAVKDNKVHKKFQQPLANVPSALASKSEKIKKFLDQRTGRDAEKIYQCSIGTMIKRGLLDITIWPFFIVLINIYSNSLLKEIGVREKFEQYADRYRASVEGSSIYTYIGLLLLLVLLALVIGTLYSTLRDVVRYYGFKLIEYDDRLVVRYGLIKTKRYTLYKKRISGFKIKRSILMRFLGYGTLEVMIIGYGHGGSEKEEAIIIPLGKMSEIKSAMAELVQVGNIQVYSAEKGAFRHFLFSPASLLIFLAYIVTSIYIFYFYGMYGIYPVFLILSLATFHLLTYVLFRYKNAAFGYNREWVVSRVGAYHTKTTYLKMEQIEITRESGTLFKLRRGYATLRMGTDFSKAMDLKADNINRVLARSLVKMLEY